MVACGEHKAPFNLIAIVNRLDLRRHRAFGEPLGGELRFVFGFLGSLCLLVQNNGTANGTAIVQGTCPTTDQTKAFDLVE